MLELVFAISVIILLISILLLINSIFANAGRSLIQGVRKVKRFPDIADAGGYVMQGMKKNRETGEATSQQRPV